MQQLHPANAKKGSHRKGRKGITMRKMYVDFDLSCSKVTASEQDE